MASKNLSTPMPCTSSFTYGKSGKTEASATKIVKGGDLRSKPGLNAGKEFSIKIKKFGGFIT